MEQERKIEKWLRTYAKKRRGQATESFKLDPATRRMLQNEISRKAPPTEDEDDTLSLWEVLRRNWAFFLGFAVCIFILASLFLPMLSAPKHAATLSQSASVQDLRQIAGSAQSRAENNRLSNTNGPPVLLTTTANPVPSGPAPALDSAQIASRNARPSSDQSGEWTFSANNAGQITNMNLAAKSPAPAGIPPALTGNYAAVQPPTAMLPQTSEANEGPSDKIAPGAAPLPAVDNNFLNTIPVPSPYTPVLRNFKVSQNGNMIRVVDQDGSIYTGTLQSEDYGVNAASWSNGGGNATRGGAATDKFNPNQTTGAGESGNNAPSSAQNYSFRVGGMNRTLKQRVVFTATLLNDLSLMKNAQVTFGMGANAAVGAAVAQQLVQSRGTNQMAQLPWSSLRIAGTAVINHTNQMRINALPIAPPTKSSSLPPN